MSNSNYTHVSNRAGQLPELTVGELNVPGNADVSGSLNVNGGITSTGTLNTAGGDQSISAAELLGGYYYVGDASGGATLTLPTGSELSVALEAVGVTSAAGTRLVNPISIAETGGGSITISGPTLGNDTVPANGTAVVHIIFTAATAYNAVVVVGA